MSFCTAGKKRFGGREIILVYTEESYRNHGYGKAVLAATTRHVLEEGTQALYSVDDENPASIAIAKSVGYEHHSTNYYFDAKRKSRPKQK